MDKIEGKTLAMLGFGAFALFSTYQLVQMQKRFQEQQDKLVELAAAEKAKEELQRR